jgi:hypothetical protein
MPPQSVEFPRFGGLDLRNDPQESSFGAPIDALNVDLSIPGRLSARAGYAVLTAAAADAPFVELMPYYRAGSTTRQLIAAKGGATPANSAVLVLNTSGAVVGTIATSTFAHHLLIRFGTPTQDLVLECPFNLPPSSSAAASVQSWDGSTWSTVTGSGTLPAIAGCVQKTDNRVVVAVPTGVGNIPVIRFSAAGSALSYPVANSVSLTPGDGEYVNNLTSWSNLVFAFKQTKFFVFYGNDTDGSGNPIFNYRAVAGGVGCVSPRGACEAPNGVYFLDRTGVYFTAGSQPAKVSAPLDPLFGKGPLPSYYQGSAINWAAIEFASLDYYNGRVFLSVPTGSSTTNDTTFVLEVASGTWAPWSTKINALTSFRIGDQEEPVMALASGTNDVVRMGQPFTYSQDAGAAIPWRYRTGFWNPGAAGAESWVREILLDGSGTVTVKSAVNDAATLGTGQAVTLGTAPAITQGRDRRGLRGRNVSYEFSGTAPARVSRVEPIVWGQRTAGEQAA